MVSWAQGTRNNEEQHPLLSAQHGAEILWEGGRMPIGAHTHMELWKAGKGSKS